MNSAVPVAPSAGATAMPQQPADRHQSSPPMNLEPAASSGPVEAPVAGPAKKAVIKWLDGMMTRVTLDLTQALLHLNNEFHDDLTYKGKSYMKLCGVTPTKY